MIKTEHNGAKDRCASGGYWGKRHDAKRDAKKLRRANDKAIVRKALKG